MRPSWEPERAWEAASILPKMVAVLSDKRTLTEAAEAEYRCVLGV